jgi:hypothetical protein
MSTKESAQTEKQAPKMVRIRNMNTYPIVGTLGERKFSFVPSSVTVPGEEQGVTPVLLDTWNEIKKDARIMKRFNKTLILIDEA